MPKNKNIIYMLSSTIQYVVRYPLQSLTTFLYWQTRLADTLRIPNTTFPLINNQTKTTDNYWIDIYTSETQIEFTQDTSYSPSAELLANYEIIKNVPSFENVEIYLLGENHYDLQHHKLKKQFVAEVAEKNDILLFEGIAHNETFACDSICLTQKSAPFRYNKNEVSKNDNGLHPLCVFSFFFKPELICKGWDDIKNYEEGLIILNDLKRMESKLKIFTTSFNSLKDQIHSLEVKLKKNVPALDFLQNLKNIYKGFKELYTGNLEPSHKFPNLGSLKKHIDVIAKTNELAINKRINLAEILVEHIKFIGSELELMNKNYNRLREFFDDVAVKNRNRLGMINTLKRHTNPSQKKIGFLGSSHLIPLKSSSNNQPIDKINKEDPQYELRQYLSNRNYAILIPKLR